MDKKKVIFVVITMVSVLASLVACALGLPYSPVNITLDGTDACLEAPAPGAGADAADAANAVSGSAVSAVTGTH